MAYLFRRKNYHGVDTGPYWIGYWKDGRRRQETTGTNNLEEAERIRATLLQNSKSIAEMLVEYGEIKPRLKAFETLFPGAVQTVRAQPTISDLLDGLLRDYVLNGRKSLSIVKLVLESRLRPCFGHKLAVELSTEDVSAYIAGRQAEGLAPVTINNQLTILKHAYTLAKIARLVGDVPHIPLLAGARKSREGFFTEEEFQRFALHGPAYLVVICEAARFTGFRKSELLRLQWRNVNLKEGWIKLEAGTTKNGDARTSPILPRLLPVLAAQWELTQKLQQQNGVIIPWVFHQDGQQVVSIRTDFENAVAGAGMPQKIFHDFRRTFRRTIAQAGLDEKTGMRLMGHRDTRTYNAYQPVTGQDMVDAVDKLQKVVTR